MNILGELDFIKDKYYIEEIASIDADTKPPLTFHLLFIPTSRDFPFSKKLFKFEINLPDNYPNEAAAFVLLDDDVPKNIREKIEAALKVRSRVYVGRRMLKGLLTYLDNNLENLLIDREVTQRYVTKGEVKVISTGSGKQSEKSDRAGKNGNRNEEESAVSEGFAKDFSNLSVLKKDDDDEMLFQVMTSKADVGPKGAGRLEKGFDASRAASGYTNTHAGDREIYDKALDEEGTSGDFEMVSVSGMKYHLHLDDLKMKNTGTLDLNSLSVDMSCKRCRMHNEANLSPGTNQVFCSRCGHDLFVVLKALHVYEGITLSADLVFANSNFLNIRSGKFSTFCIECGERIPCNSLPGNFNYICRNCHTRVEVHFASFSTEDDLNISTQVRRKKKPHTAKKPRDDFSLRSGKELPNNGACDHYGKSYRWFRFPCCRRPYPCDVCHDAAADHKTDDLATTMICGFCSKEQPVGSKCKSCGKDVTGSSSSKGRHWEGGKGCRDLTILSRKDSRKRKLRK